MSKEQEKPTRHCLHLDGTDSFSCNYEGPYKWQKRGQPTLSRIAFGLIQKYGGEQKGRHLRCVPAEEMFAHRDSPKAITYEELVRQQAEYSQFEEGNQN